MSWLCCFNIKRFPQRCFAASLRWGFQTPSGKSPDSRVRAQSPEQDLGLGPFWAAPAPLTAGIPTGHSNATLTNGTTLTRIYSFYSTHFFLHYRDCQVHDTTLVTVPELNKKPHSSAVKASQLHSFSQKPFCLILQDLTHYLIMFSTLGDCWQHSIFLQPVPQGFGNSLLVHIKFVVNSSPENHTASYFLAFIIYKWVKN